MIDALLISIFVIAGVGVGFYGLDLLPAAAVSGANITGARFVTSGFGGVVGLALGAFVRWAYRRFEANVRSLPLDILIARAVGLVFGLLLANLAMGPVYVLPLPPEFTFIEPLTSVFFSLGFAYLGVSLGDTHGRSLLRLFNPNLAMQVALMAEGTVQPATAKVLDTSCIIDGRIVHLIETGFIEGTLVVPRFVLLELQTIADKADGQKRERGRRGLDILQDLQDAYPDRFVIHEADFPDLPTVDEKLVRLTHEVHGALLTTDFNLNKVATIQQIPVLNVNELAEALRPAFIPGDRLEIKIIKEGKEPGQGIGYLEDGTMVVVEEGQVAIGRKCTTLVTSAIQTPAGRMIFAKLKPTVTVKS